MSEPNSITDADFLQSARISLDMHPDGEFVRWEADITFHLDYPELLMCLLQDLQSSDRGTSLDSVIKTALMGYYRDKNKHSRP